MSINLSPVSAFSQQTPLIKVTSEEAICHWNVNEFVIHLTKENDSIKYKTIDRDQKEIYTNCIEIPESKNLEWMLSHLKQCKVMVDENGVARFLKPYNTWANTDIEISLVRETEGLAWNVFRKATNESFFLDFQKNTIPSLQCHPETIELIEKIKTEIFKDKKFNSKELLDSLISDFKVSVIDLEKFKEKLDSEKSRLDQTLSTYELDAQNSWEKDKTKNIPAGIATVCLSWNALTTIANSVNVFFGSGALGVVCGGYARLLAGSLIGGMGGAAAACFVRLFFPLPLPDFLCKKQPLKEKPSFLPLENSLIVEVEPISIPSRIDKRIHVSKFTWAVTLITHNGSEGNHVKIIVEGINDGFCGSKNLRTKNGEAVENGEKFTYMAEFDPPIKSKLFPLEKELVYETRTEIWMRTSREVKKLLESIEIEKATDKEEQLFNYWGIHSKIYKFNPLKFNFSGEVGDNCFTWARKKLKILDIHIEGSYVEYAASIAKCYTRNKEDYQQLPIHQLI